MSLLLLTDRIDFSFSVYFVNDFKAVDTTYLCSSSRDVLLVLNYENLITSREK
jgi:hypothetical protein